MIGILHIFPNLMLFTSEVEEICQTNSQIEEAKKGRLRITGRTKTGRIISAFFDPEPEEEVYFPVSAGDASTKEKRDYQAWCKDTLCQEAI